MTNIMVDVEHLDVCFSGFYAVRDVCFSVQAGEIFYYVQHLVRLLLIIHNFQREWKIP